MINFVIPPQYLCTHTVEPLVAATSRDIRQLKGHSQLVHMRIRYHSMANLHITETLSILVLTKYDKTTLQNEQKHTPKKVFQQRIENQAEQSED